MNNNWNIRTGLIVGNKALAKLSDSHVLVAGIGGVGAHVSEYLCRAGIGSLTLVDNDVVDTTNRNRQLPALSSTAGKYKVDVMTERLKDINPDINITKIKDFIRDEKTNQILTSSDFDYVVDAIDTLSPKVHLILNCLQLKLNLISSMGAGGKMNPSLVKIADISKTYNCGLARAVRKRLKRYNIYKGVRVVFSPEEPTGETIVIDEDSMDRLQNKNSIVGTISYMPSLFGCFCASEVIMKLIQGSTPEIDLNE